MPLRHGVCVSNYETGDDSISDGNICRVRAGIIFFVSLNPNQTESDGSEALVIPFGFNDPPLKISEN